MEEEFGSLEGFHGLEGLGDCEGFKDFRNQSPVPPSRISARLQKKKSAQDLPKRPENLGRLD